MSTEVLCLSADEVDRLLDIDTAIDSQRAAFASLARGTTSPAEKIMVPGGPDGSVAVCYAARLSTETGPVCKFVSVNPANARLGLPSISGVLMALDPEADRPVAIMDGAIVTAVRTAAARGGVVQLVGHRLDRDVDDQRPALGNEDGNGGGALGPDREKTVVALEAS